MKVAEAIGKTLVELGVEVFFVLVGSGNFAVVNALGAAGGEFYSSRHECAAVVMADGYAWVSGKKGTLELPSTRSNRWPSPSISRHSPAWKKLLPCFSAFRRRLLPAQPPRRSTL